MTTPTLLGFDSTLNQMESLLIVLLVISVLVICFLAFRVGALSGRLDLEIVAIDEVLVDFEKFQETSRKTYSALESEFDKVKFAKKSSEVRLGRIAEQMAPFLDEFKRDPEKSQFLGQPVDYIVFDDAEVIFVEVKSGNAKLSDRQKRIKKLVDEGKVRFELVRIKGIDEEPS